jgi:hypothetical protein
MRVYHSATGAQVVILTLGYHFSKFLALFSIACPVQECSIHLNIAASTDKQAAGRATCSLPTVYLYVPSAS